MSAIHDSQPASLPEALAAITLLRQELAGAQLEIKLLQGKLQAFIRAYFGGQKNESIDPRQLELLLQGLQAATTADPQPPVPPPPPPAREPSSKTERTPARSGIPEDLPIERVVLIPDEVKANPEGFRQIEELITRELEWEPGRFFWRHYVRPKFVRRDTTAAASSSSQTQPEGSSASPRTDPLAAAAKLPPIVAAMLISDIPEFKEVLIAALPNRLIEKGLPGVGLLVHLILSRFEDHIPFFRMEGIFRNRHGVPLARQTMVDWTEKVAFWLKPIYDQMAKEAKATGYLQVDETFVRYLDREVPGKSQQGYLWTYSHPGGDVIFDWSISRGRDAPAQFLYDFKGKLQTDGYVVYDSLAQERSNSFQLFACWSHARRNFLEAAEHDRRAAWVLKQIALLYALEKRLRQRKAGPALRQAHRAAEASMVLHRLEKALKLWQGKELKQSKLGQALAYALNLWTELARYVQHGEVEIDNNLVENDIRPTAVGKKAFLFIGHPDAGWRSAVIYSILGSCRRRGINPAQYLKDVLVRLPDMTQSQIPTITPAAWATAHPEARIKSKSDKRPR